MVFEHYKAIFLHSGRTGGTSIEVALSPCLIEHFPIVNAHPNHKILFGWDPVRGIYLQHATAKTVFEILGPDFLKHYIFSVVRDPYARIRSVYAYQASEFKKTYANFKSFVLALPNLISSPQNRAGSHFLPQRAFTSLDGENICNRILRFESILEDYPLLQVDLGIPGKLPHMNGTTYPEEVDKPLSQLYDQDMRAVIQEIYAEDFHHFHYPTQPGGVSSLS
ncbi:MAG: sulfotransferase family 2 domain-containing protein [Bdellovibrionales bacterium]|nr:sulfotransferase family 2 domain-containing protein [Bdellovibrionales bacterium]